MMIDYLNEHKNMFMAGLAAFCVAMMIISATVEFGTGFLRRSAGFVFVPVMSAFSNTGGWIAGRVGSIVNIGTLEAENTRLRAENEKLTLLLGLAETRVDHLAEIEQLLYVYDSIFSDFSVMGAYIFARDMGIWYSTPLIRAGRNAGVAVGMPVVTGALFGRITEVGHNYARIRTIIEDTSSIAVFGERTGDEGFARGDHSLMLQGLMRLDFSSQNAEFAVGDMIKTSALSSFFPPGLLVGEIIEIRTAPGGSRHAIVQPLADIASARMVLVLMDSFEFELQ